VVSGLLTTSKALKAPGSVDVEGRTGKGRLVVKLKAVKRKGDGYRGLTFVRNGESTPKYFDTM